MNLIMGEINNGCSIIERFNQCKWFNIIKKIKLRKEFISFLNYLYSYNYDNDKLIFDLCENMCEIYGGNSNLPCSDNIIIQPYYIKFKHGSSHISYSASLKKFIIDDPLFSYEIYYNSINIPRIALSSWDNHIDALLDELINCIILLINYFSKGGIQIEQRRGIIKYICQTNNSKEEEARFKSLVNEAKALKKNGYNKSKF